MIIDFLTDVRIIRMAPYVIESCMNCDSTLLDLVMYACQKEIVFREAKTKLCDMGDKPLSDLMRDNRIFRDDSQY